MIVDAEVYVWTSTGMRRTTSNQGYIATREVERLLEEAHARGQRSMRTERADWDEHRRDTGEP